MLGGGCRVLWFLRSRITVQSAPLERPQESPKGGVVLSESRIVDGRCRAGSSRILKGRSFKAMWRER